jgi:hypothetical protein
MVLAASRSSLASAGVKYARDRTSILCGFTGSNVGAFLYFAENNGWRFFAGIRKTDRIEIGQLLQCRKWSFSAF